MIVKDFITKLLNQHMKLEEEILVIDTKTTKSFSALKAVHTVTNVIIHANGSVLIVINSNSLKEIA